LLVFDSAIEKHDLGRFGR